MTGAGAETPGTEEETGGGREAGAGEAFKQLDECGVLHHCFFQV